MKLASLIQEQHVLIHSPAGSLREVIGALLRALAPRLEGVDLEALAEAVMRNLSRQGRETGDAICHAHLRDARIKEFSIALAVLERPAPRPGDGGAPAQAVFLVLAPQDQNTRMLQALMAIQRLTANQTFRSSAGSVRSAARLLRLIEESGVDVRRTLTAADIMEPVPATLPADMALTEAVNLLAHERDEGLPVVDDRGKLVGELTTREVLVLGMPKYMDLISNPEMLNALEPFENYFMNCDRMKVRDICRRDFGAVKPSSPIVRVTHDMITANRRRVYVLDEEKIEGVIYRKSILTRVMNL